MAIDPTLFLLSTAADRKKRINMGDAIVCSAGLLISQLADGRQLGFKKSIDPKMPPAILSQECRVHVIITPAAQTTFINLRFS